MRHVPVAIHRVTMKSAPDMIVHSARSHFAQRKQSHLEGMLAGFAFWITRVTPYSEIECHRSGEFWGIAEPTFLRVVTTVDLPVSRLQDRCIDFAFDLSG